MKRVWSEGGYGPLVVRAVAIAALGTLFLSAVSGWALALAGRMGLVPGAAPWFRDWLAAGGWLKLPLLAAGLAVLFHFPRARNWPQRILTGWVVFKIAVATVTLHTMARLPVAEAPPTDARAKGRAILKWSYKTPETVLRIVGMSRDPDPMVREQAVLALGVNRIVTDVEHATVTRPSRDLASPVRDSLRTRLRECLADPVESVRAEAARALWKAPVTFGPSPAAAETLAAILGRAADPRRPERLAWLALDAAAGAPDPALRGAAQRFAAMTSDPKLARYARLATASRQ